MVSLKQLVEPLRPSSPWPSLWPFRSCGHGLRRIVQRLGGMHLYYLAGLIVIFQDGQLI